MPEIRPPTGSAHPPACDLCGLSLRRGRVPAVHGDKAFAFCCNGCRQVFAVLMAANSSEDPEEFKDTDLYKQCVAAGILPAAEADLDRMAGTPPSLSGPEASAEEAAGASDDALELHLQVANMWCPACAWLIDTALAKTAGVIEARCNFATDRLQVRYNPVQTSPHGIIAAVGRLGYRAAEAGEKRQAQAQRKAFIRFVICAFLTMNVMMLSFAVYSGFLIELTADNLAKLSWPMLVMSAVVLIYGGLEFFRKAWIGLFSATAGMETLIIIGAASAFAYSVVNQLAGSLHLYYDTACLLITLVLLGKALESRAKRQVLEDLEAFFALMPTKVRICTAAHPHGRYVSIGQLAAGDSYRVSSDDIVPADGRILDGKATVLEAAITGEPVPTVKKTGDSIRSGARIQAGELTIMARQVGADSTLGQMIAIIERTLLTKTPLEGRTDLILRWFVPAILVLAAATAVASRLAGLPTAESILRAVTVTVISCPCALGIAIPLARVAGVSLAGKRGMLVRDFSAFETAGSIDTIVFDKTGTITHGQWDLKAIRPIGDFSEAQALALAAGIEAGCEHFIGREILRQTRLRAIRPLPVTDIHSEDGGLEGRLDGRPVRIGSAGYLADVFKGTEDDAKPLVGGEGVSRSRVYLGFEGRPAAIFFFGDGLRPGVIDMITDLKRHGFRLALVSGDGDAVTCAVAEAVGIAEALGGQLPADKAAFIAGLQREGRCVAMVGDGINDAPALVRADLAIAVHSGGTLAKEAADISFMRGVPDQLTSFFDFAGQVNRKIRQNLVFTFLYNVAAVPAAMLGLLNPLIAVSAMLLSSISVTANTLLLVKRSEPSR